MWLEPTHSRNGLWKGRGGEPRSTLNVCGGAGGEGGAGGAGAGPGGLTGGDGAPGMLPASMAGLEWRSVAVVLR